MLRRMKRQSAKAEKDEAKRKAGEASGATVEGEAEGPPKKKGRAA